MSRTGYQIGRQAEWDLLAYLRQRGWVALRSAGSRGAVDIAAFKAGERPRLIQLKFGKGNLYKGFPPADRARLAADARRAGARAQLCRWYAAAEEPVFIEEADWPRPSGKTFADYMVDPETGCWLWDKAVGADGYGQLRRTSEHGVQYLAHRWYWQEANGPIPAELEIDHLCRVRPCVNPAHLEAVSREENVRRSPITKLTPEQVLEIRESKDSLSKTAIRYGVTKSAIARIRKGQVWKDVA